MFVDLDTIWWSSLTGHGSCAEVPELLRAIASGEDFDRSFDQLRQIVCHQGTVYEVSSYVVPFLYELVESADNVEELINLLSLLSSMATANAEQESWSSNTREALVEKGMLLTGLLSHKGAGVRSWAAYTAGCTRGKAAVPDLLARLDLEGHPSVLATVLFVLSDLESAESVGPAETYLNSDDFSIKYAAAIVLARMHKADLPEEAVDVLTSVLLDADVMEAELGDLNLFPHQSVRNMTEFAAEAFEAIGRERAARAVPKLLLALKNMPWQYVDEPLSALLAATFEPDCNETLTEHQSNVLTTLKSFENVWSPQVLAIRKQQFGRYGLPV